MNGQSARTLFLRHRPAQRSSARISGPSGTGQLASANVGSCLTTSVAKTIGILTGGGDCPGLNAVIRAVVRASDVEGWDCVAVLEGWRGLVEGRFRDLGPREVSGILPRGGTIIGTSRTNPYKIEGGVEKVLRNFH